MSKKMTTPEAARALRVCRRTLHAWVNKSVVTPEVVRHGANSFYLFSERDLERARAFQRSLHRKGWKSGANAEHVPARGEEGAPQ